VERSLRDIRLSGPQIEEIVARTHSLGQTARGPLNARFRYLAGLGFPREVGRRGQRIGFDLEETMQLVTAFLHLETGQPPLRVARSVLANWPAYARAYHQSWTILQNGEAAGAGTRANRVILAISPAALQEATSDLAEPERQAFEAVQVMRVAELSQWAEVTTDDLDDAHLMLLDPLRVLRRTIAQVETVGAFYPFEIAAAFAAWSERLSAEGKVAGPGD
jgi:hypothetical protein